MKQKYKIIETEKNRRGKKEKKKEGMITDKDRKGNEDSRE